MLGVRTDYYSAKRFYDLDRTDEFLISPKPVFVFKVAHCTPVDI